MSQLNRTPEITTRAKALRANATPAERKLWSALRSGQMGASFRRQHPIGPFFADFCCPALKLVIEVDGGQHHADAVRDEARTRFLNAQGYEVLRFWNVDVMDGFDGVCEQVGWAVKRKLFERSADTDPLPSSPFQGEG